MSKIMTRFIALVLCFLFSITAMAADSTYKVKYDGGSLTDMKAGTGITLSVGATNIKFFGDKKELAGSH